MFITFEGIEGSGKSTQLKKVASYLEKKGFTVTTTKEPGDSSLGKTIRSILLSPETTLHHNYTELLLFIADRCEHVESVIKPALKKGHIVLCDRYKDSTVAYQHGGRQLEKETIHQLNKLIDLNPDATLLFDCDPTIGLSRAKARSAADRFEQETLHFHHRIRDTYVSIAKEDPQRVSIIEADKGDIDTIFNHVITQLNKVLTTRSINHD